MLTSIFKSPIRTNANIASMLSKQFLEVIQLIRNSRIAAMRSVNTALISLYWNIGEYISRKVKYAEWGAIRS